MGSGKLQRDGRYCQSFDRHVCHLERFAGERHGDVTFGGTLKASTSTATFFSGVGNACVCSSVAASAIDNGGNNITIGQTFSAPTGNGVSASGLIVSGSGFLGIPLVQSAAAAEPGNTG